MALSEIKGIGSATEERLNDAGVQTIDDLASAKIQELTPFGISESKAQKIIERARKQGVVIQSGAEVEKEYQNKEERTTGMDALDKLIGGGWREDHIVGLSGESSAGKTQLVFQSLVAAVEETGDPAVYIETERGRYEPERINSLASDPETQKKVYRIKAYNLDQQLLAYQKVAESMDEVSLVAVDSFTARFRLSDKFEGRSSLQQRSKEFGRHLNTLEEMIETTDCPVLITLQIYGNPSAYGSASSTYGGELLNHTVTYFVKMSKDKGSLRKAELHGHPGEGEGEVYLTIGEDEIKAVEEV